MEQGHEHNVSFGQGLSLTPLQITRFYGALVNDGVECRHSSVEAQRR